MEHVENNIKKQLLFSFDLISHV